MITEEEKKTLDQLIKLYNLSPALRQVIIHKITYKPTEQKIYFIKGCSRYQYNRRLKTITKTKSSSGCGCGR